MKGTIMIKLLKTKNFSMTVILKDGSVFQNKDVPEYPFGEYEKLVAFWHEDKIRVYSMEAVQYIEFIPNE